ncbi:PEP-CTERM sorting domain-containing protein [Sphingomonas sp. LR60]|uniref:PEP-CTERM sorting domain-containing protein n=1 Tax=Sphingomonas sp. LR60 TaxID=3050233 RepID=UPI002FE22D69
MSPTSTTSEIGGVPGLFKRFTEQAGLDWQVSLETSGGKTLGWHLAERRAVLDRLWDHVVLQEYSTLDPARPGDGAATIADAARIAEVLRTRNPKVAITLTSTWTRPDLVFLPNKPWSGTPIEKMAIDVRRVIDAAARRAKADVAPVGQAFTCAIRSGVADANPYDGIDYTRVPLWSYDHYHASSYGYYIEALVVFARVTGVDPLSLGAREAAAGDLGFSEAETVALQQSAHDAITTNGGCGR